MDAESVQIIGDLYVNLVRARGEILRLKAEIERLRKDHPSETKAEA